MHAFFSIKTYKHLTTNTITLQNAYGIQVKQGFRLTNNHEQKHWQKGVHNRFITQPQSQKNG